ncbi:hypothetical protein EJ04DRAFT_488215 [Polyplosphaeria fusca]|uniref:Uncharacterized protein n=1 Tax=Polyplosphaeria fusca TaxID=682080 RepID=A0A9P4R139_9PLEO|nr:hypothetical protein EJ04DRAFT_488215 [Polyplosphaeria fusca]
MASKLCCTVEQESRPDSPDLPPARVSEITPARQPLLLKRPGSSASRFTSALSEDLHELRQIFDSAQHVKATENSPPKLGIRIPRPSIHSLHRVKSVQAFIKRKLSKDLTSSTPPSRLGDSGKQKITETEDVDTMIKVPRHGPNLELKITKNDLRKDLLSDKKPADGGYDSDAEVLDDLARNIGKKSPSKRPSIHSIDWTPSPGGKCTPGSSNSLVSKDPQPEKQYYQLERPPTAKTSLIAAFNQFTSSPNLRLVHPGERDRKLRRSHSATSIERRAAEEPPLRLPSITSDDAVPWSISMQESLRLSQFPAPPSLKFRKDSLRERLHPASSDKISNFGISNHSTLGGGIQALPATETVPLQIHIQQATSPRASSSIKINAAVTQKVDGSHPAENNSEDINDEGDASNSRSARNSVHLYSMRISHHLRSGSLLSWNTLADAPEMPTPPRHHTMSDKSRSPQRQQVSEHARHERLTSSSGFASSRVPSKWGKVLRSDRGIKTDLETREDKSSIYSSRPQSPPDSFGHSRTNLSLNDVNAMPANNSAGVLNDVDSCPTDEEKTPKAPNRHGLTKLEATSKVCASEPLIFGPIARNNSVSATKKSKFREEFSPSPPKKASTTSLLKFLRPRNSVRSRSDTSLKNSNVDGAYDVDNSASRERRVSKSMMSLQAEQAALGKDKDAIPIWEKALKAHQEEKASMFLPGNKSLAVRSSPFRERNSSSARPGMSMAPISIQESSKTTRNRLSLPTMQGSYFIASPFGRRHAVISPNQDDDARLGQDTNIDINKQKDNKETIGIWGSYPSHSRDERTASAGYADSIHSRDFALEAAIRFAKGEDIDPIARAESPVTDRDRKGRKRVGSGRMAKSSSMTFGKTFLKNYTKLFRSQSSEFRQHGHGHRSSVATGGMLEYPELEIVPGVWHRGITEASSHDTDIHEPIGDKTQEKMKSVDSQVTLRPRRTSDPLPAESPSSLAFDGLSGQSTAADRARVWSVYYEDCIPHFPSVSMDLDLSLQLSDFSPARPVSRQVSMLSKTMPARIRHSRAESKVSRMSFTSGVPSWDEDVDGHDGMSMTSVRRSTLELMKTFKEQGERDMERVLELARSETLKR